MSRIPLSTFLFCLLMLALPLVLAPDVHAHGGQFVGPGDSVPPGLREPFDPTPPPPPPPPTPGPSPVTPGTGVPTFGGTPVTPTGGTPAVTMPGSGAPLGGKRRTPPSFEDWTFWYHNNNTPIENLKWRLYHPQSTHIPIFGSSESFGDGVLGGEMRLTEKRVRATVIPALLWAMDGTNVNYTDTESAAYIALAKVTRDPAHIAAIRAGLDLEQKRDRIIMDAAALGLGLLRRALPSAQFTARELDAVREFLFEVFEDDRYPTRTRGFAAIAIGLLGDQPTGSGEWAGDQTGAANDTTARLFALLDNAYAQVDLPVGVVTAIGLQQSDTVSAEQRAVLVECALKGRIGRRKSSDVMRAHAALALGRIGTRSDIRSLANMLTVRKVPDGVRRSAAIGLGVLGKLVSGEARVEAANVLLGRLEKTSDNSTRNFALIALAQLLREDVRTASTDLLSSTRADEVLLEVTTKGSYVSKGFAALGLGLVLREIEDELEVEAWQLFREDALGLLRKSVVSRKFDNSTRAAFCTALGIAQDDGSRETLRKMVDDRRGDRMLRGYATLALGLIGNPTAEVTRTIAQALAERSSEDLRRHAATALGLLGNPVIPGTRKDAVDLLLDELRDARTQSHKGQVVLALARVGDHRALVRLTEVLQDPKEQALTRALACSGLGLIGDLEMLPSLSRASKDVNYRAATDLINEYLSIL